MSHAKIEDTNGHTVEVTGGETIVFVDCFSCVDPNHTFDLQLDADNAIQLANALVKTVQNLTTTP